MKNTMTYKGYTTSMEFDADDRILVGRVLHIDDIISFHGESVAEFEAAFEESVDGYVASCEKLGQKGQRADIGIMTIYRMLPNRYANKVGSFVFLDHISPTYIGRSHV